ncbi:preprotein translocase subunit YajC [Chloroflexota bacterium]
MKKIVRNGTLKLWSILGALITMVLLSGCFPTEAPAEGEGTSIIPLILFLVLIFGFMYFVIIRPQRKKQQEHQQLIEELNKGDRVVTAGGLYGVVESISEESVVIKVESGALLRVAKESVTIKRER